ncbi:MAG: multicopper oxidase domain-containing protein [Crocinitomicaceae bacterium]|nr:multicopper oxidase domain-containing protein [Crocinitomicaceae bacterium]MDG1776285.1 multicopper oxidase domain-containing protein [Crocinitomicaceae bacterium]
MSKIILASILTFIVGFNGMSGTVTKSLYIVSGSLLSVDNNLSPYITFNDNPVFTQENPIINLYIGDTLDLWVYNTDLVDHGFVINDVNVSINIAPGDSVFVQQEFASSGVFIYHDSQEYPKYTYLGLAGLIVVKDHSQPCFYWNLKEHNADWNNQLFNGGTVNWSDYDPKYFTINARSNPNINMDTLARITGSIGDTLHLQIANTGQGVHSIHFHGYHGVIKYSSKNPSHIGREKDTFPIYPMETMTIQIIPDKSGEYPVHDHNLAAVTGNNIYPNGMFSTILITP